YLVSWLGPAPPADGEQDDGKEHVGGRAHWSSPLPAAPASSCRSASIRSRSARPAATLACGSRPSCRSRWTTASETERLVVVPSGSMAGMSTALCSAYTPGGGSGATWPLSILRRATSRCVGLGVVRSRCASTIAPSAAVISRALVTSNGNTYVVKISCARPVRL